MRTLTKDELECVSGGLADAYGSIHDTRAEFRISPEMMKRLVEYVIKLGRDALATEFFFRMIPKGAQDAVSRDIEETRRWLERDRNNDGIVTHEERQRNIEEWERSLPQEGIPY